MITRVTSIDAIEKALKKNEKVCCVFKHSATCPISAAALEQVDAFAQDYADVPIYMVVVQECRDVSDRVEQYFAIKHESPQVLIIRDGAYDHHMSHRMITQQSLEDELVRV